MQALQFSSTTKPASTHSIWTKCSNTAALVKTGDQLAHMREAIPKDLFAEAPYLGGCFHVTSDPALISALFSQDRNNTEACFYRAPDKTITLQLFRRLFPDLDVQPNDFILSCDPETTKKFHRFFSDEFSRKSISERHEEIVSIAESTIDVWARKGDVTDLYQACKLFTSRVICKVFLDYEGDYEQLTRAMSTIGRMFTSLFTPKGMAMSIAEKAGIVFENKELQDVQDVIIHAIELALDQKDSIIQQMQNSQEGFNDNQVIMTTTTLMFAAQDNTATLLTFLLHMLARRPDLVERLRNEEEGLMKRCIVEALRVCPPAFGAGRTPNGKLEMTFNGKSAVVDSNAGDVVAVCPYLAARDPSIAPLNPDDFEPDRHEKIPEYLPSLPWSPFGGGKQVCIGWRLVVEEVSVLVQLLVREYDIRTDTSGDLPVKGGFTIVLPDGIHLRLMKII